MLKKKSTQVFHSFWNTCSKATEASGTVSAGRNKKGRKEKKKSPASQAEDSQEEGGKICLYGKLAPFHLFWASLQTYKEGKSHLNQFLMKPRTPGCSYKAAHLSWSLISPREKIGDGRTEAWPFMSLPWELACGGPATFVERVLKQFLAWALHQSCPPAPLAPWLWLQGALCECLAVNRPMKPQVSSLRQSCWIVTTFWKATEQSQMASLSIHGWPQHPLPWKVLDGNCALIHHLSSCFLDGDISFQKFITWFAYDQPSS